MDETNSCIEIVEQELQFIYNQVLQVPVISLF